jgi:hypothetical protein
LNTRFKPLATQGPRFNRPVQHPARAYATLGKNHATI